jgi:hypothetical protein
MPLLLRSTIVSALLLAAARIGFSQAADQTQSDSVRVTVAINQDGSRTVYQFQDAEHKAIATTTGEDGKVREKIRYQLDDAGHFSSASIFGPDGKLRFKSRYHYDSAGRLQEELQMDAKEALLHKLVYSYNEAGKPTGYSVFDADGKLINRVAATNAVPISSPAPRKKSSQR